MFNRKTYITHNFIRAGFFLIWSRDTNSIKVGCKGHMLMFGKNFPTFSRGKLGFEAAGCEDGSEDARWNQKRCKSKTKLLIFVPCNINC